MKNSITYHRRVKGEVLSASNASEIFQNWRGNRERWLFVSAHDDDAVMGAGLTMLAARAEEIEVHAIVTSDGSMGYCEMDQRDTIADIRKRESVASYGGLGVPPERIHFLGFPDGNLEAWAGRRMARNGDVGAFAGYTGLQNSYTRILRQVIPTRVFVPTITDLHPDHQVSNREMMISLFHAQGEIWPELGRPIAEAPEAYEYATYCDFSEPPQIKIGATEEMLAKKIEAIEAFASQRQIGLLVRQLREGGAVEYLHEMRFNFYSPRVYENLF